jgi:ABC-type dipeptide/oligopeptide/nickel transport system ATPase component
MTADLDQPASGTRAGTAPVLTVDGLGVRTGDRQLVRGVSFTVAAGERVGLIGESGSGKSLTVLATFGLLPEGVTAEGSARLHLPTAPEGHEMVGRRDADVRGLRGDAVSMVFQEPLTALNPTMRVGSQVAEVIRLHRSGMSREAVRAEVLRLFDQVRLPDPQRAARAFPHELSGGQRQRVVIAMALANSPSLIIADEPTTALDVTVQAQILSLLDETVTRTGAALLFITHDLAVVAEQCDRALVMLNGEVVESGPIPQVFLDPQHEYTRGLVAASDLSARDERGRLLTVASSREATTRRDSGPARVIEPGERSGPSEEAVRV